MDRKIALKWAKALESGEYEQTDGRLRSRDDGFCCLGVLCNLHAAEHPEIAAAQDDPQFYMCEDANLPREVVEWAGMFDRNGSFKDGFKIEDCDSVAKSLIDLNDDLGYDFKQIAKVIRKHSAGL